MKLLVILFVAFATVVSAEEGEPSTLDMVKGCILGMPVGAKVACVGDVLGSALSEGKAGAFLDKADAQVKDFLREKEEQIKQYWASKQGVFGSVKELKDKAQAWFKETFGKRQKRDMPTQDEVQMAKKVKICMDMYSTTAEECLKKIFGDDVDPNIDLVKVDTIVKYEAVLAELKEFFEYKKNGGTLKEFNEMKKQQKAAGKRRLANRNMLTDFKAKVEKCRQESGKNIAQCVTSILGEDLSSWINRHTEKAQ